MTPTLIDQLKLAIQVESGELSMEDIQCRPKHPGYDWGACSTTPQCWNHKDYEYRRKPKPLELWVNVYENGVITAHSTQEHATDCRPVAGCGHCKLYHMREVKND